MTYQRGSSYVSRYEIINNSGSREFTEKSAIIALW